MIYAIGSWVETEISIKSQSTVTQRGWFAICFRKHPFSISNPAQLSIEKQETAKIGGKIIDHYALVLNKDDFKTTLFDGIEGKSEADAILEMLNHSAFGEQVPDLSA